jgi:tetratricopeptide (TPR) repeat protein
MRYYFFLIFVLLISKTVCAQNQRELRMLNAEADRFYAEEQYHLAIQYYRELADYQGADPGVAYNLAECYRKTFNYPEAEAYYLKVYFQAPGKYPLSLYYYALMLKFNGNFDESTSYFDEFILTHRDSNKWDEYVEQAIIDQAGCETAKEELAAGTTAAVLSLAFNTTFNDYAPAVVDSNSMVITSGRITSNRQAIDERFGEAFTDNYYFVKQGSVWVDRTR